MVNIGDHVMHMGRCAIVLYVYPTTAHLAYVKPMRGRGTRIDAYISDLVIPRAGHVCV